MLLFILVSSKLCLDGLDIAFQTIQINFAVKFTQRNQINIAVKFSDHNLFQDKAFNSFPVVKNYLFCLPR